MLHAFNVSRLETFAEVNNKEDPATYELRSFRCSIVNPLLSFAIPSDTFESKNINERLLGILPDGSVLVETSVIHLITPESPEPSEAVFVPDPTRGIGAVQPGSYLEKVGAFLECLRYASKSSQLVSLIDFYASSTEEVQLPPVKFPQQVETESSAHVSTFLVNAAVRWKHLEIADELLAGEGVPVYGTLLLDAIAALREQDYRRAILYSAIAVETMAGTRLSEVYQHHLTARDADDRFRFLSLPTRDGTVVKDPIYAYLESRTDFKLLIHEQALYVLGRSLLVEDEQLFQAATKLYSTRNKIVHQGELPTENTNNYFPFNNQGAEACINCAIEMFQWFGVPGGYFIPAFGFVRVKTAKMELPEESAG